MKSCSGRERVAAEVDPARIDHLVLLDRAPSQGDKSGVKSPENIISPSAGDLTKFADHV
jgi:hypothetical protein